MPKFPMKFKECPMCQCKKTITRLAWKEMVAQGRIGKDSVDLPLASRREAVPLIDPKRGVQLSAKVLTFSFDRCAKCGTEYCVRAEIITAPVQMRKPPGGQGLPPGFPQ